MKKNMDEVRLGVMSCILKFLKDEFKSGYLDPENAEGLEVAIHCLENIYDVSKVHRNGNIPSLVEIYEAYPLNVALASKDATEEEKAEGERLKVQGNVAMNFGKYTEALEYYSRAIKLNPKNAVYYCNRAAAHSKMNNHDLAVNDCKMAIGLDPKYSKAYGRLGLAYCGLEDYMEAVVNYKMAYDLEPDNEGYKRNYELANQKISEMCTNTFPGMNNAASTSTGQNPTFTMPNMPNNMNAGNEAAANPMGSPMDLNALFGNSQLVNFASQMLADPAMQNMMSSIINQENGQNMQTLLQVGQNLARQMQHNNPHFFVQLRNSFEGMPRNDEGNQGGGGEDGSSHEKQQ